MSKPSDLHERVEKLLAAATPGPWRRDKEFHSSIDNQKVTHIVADDKGCAHCGKGDGEWLIARLFRHATKEYKANAELIAAAPELLRALLAEAKALRVERDELWKLALVCGLFSRSRWGEFMDWWGDSESLHEQLRELDEWTKFGNALKTFLAAALPAPPVEREERP